MNSKSHLYISLIKSIIRIIACFILLWLCRMTQLDYLHFYSQRLIVIGELQKNYLIRDKEGDNEG